MGIIMTGTQNPVLITYADSSRADWQEFRPGSRRKVLYEDSGTGQLTMLVQWDAGYRMGVVEHHEYDEHLYILAGTFVDEQRASGPGTYILNRAGSEHQAYTPDGCTFLEVVPGRSR
jgi:mannose-6-phosphate isomerase-like protein (cupin superfamily)